MTPRPASLLTCSLAFVLATGPAATPLLCSAQGPAPATQSKNLSFDVATVKPSAPLDMAAMAADIRAGRTPRIGPRVDASRAEYLYMPLRQLIAVAYQVKDYQVSGPDWLGTQRFDIEATIPEGASKEDVPAMLQSLLVERFKLAAHRDTEEHKVLALVVGKNGPKMKESTTKPEPIDENAPLKPGEMKVDGPDGPARMTINGNGSAVLNMGVKGTITYKFDAKNQLIHMESSTVTMEGFAETLTRILTRFGGSASRQVVDMTNLKGTYEVAVDMSLADMMTMARSEGFGPPPAPTAPSANAGPASAASDPANAATIYQSVEKMGLHLEEHKAPVDLLVIDHVEKTPTEN